MTKMTRIEFETIKKLCSNLGIYIENSEQKVCPASVLIKLIFCSESAVCWIQGK